MAHSKSEKLIHLLADNLDMRRESILNLWRTRCQQDQSLNSKMGFAREEFNDQVPALLNILAQRLRGEIEESDPLSRAGEHGLHRWQRGYSLPELLTELEHLYWIILDEVRAFQQQHRQLTGDSLSLIYRQVFELEAESKRGSVLYYDQLRQTNAAEQANSLQESLDKLQQLSKQQGDHLRQNSHDLRSSFGILMGAANLLQLPNTEKERVQFVDMLNRNLASIRGMLLQLTDYARIEAGQEKVDVSEFDAATLVRECVDLAQPLVDPHNFVLQGDGPDTLPVRSDAIKVQRILQNLLYNAIKYTKSGWVYVSWAQENETRWILSVQDSGTGYTPNSPTSLLAEQLRPLSQPSSTHQSGGPGEYPLQEPPTTESLKSPSASHQKESEGLGLFIVKKLCELLRASMDIESAPGKGTLVRIRFLSNQEASNSSD
ncbi:sensor histidine kinase [Spirosoma agri]|uniref:histidine kinase n=1 Tax=Spirosoma agri TaxID=1987381 RepID=A0A6M0IR95_9BACT|nr:HAMP domain-containing sensor histidine kinase [Spirosoma agri]NEU70492.1 HAMP domain-containing histidine kinase [Spirosoma agri]